MLTYYQIEICKQISGKFDSIANISIQDNALENVLQLFC